MTKISVFACVLLVAICSSAQPAIMTFSPTSGNIGATITITGTNFNTIASNNIVFFGATKASVSNASTNSLIVTVPQGATYAPITVVNTITGLSSNSLTNFIPTFSSIKPNIIQADFLTKVDYTTNKTPYSVVLGDIDGDGKPDLIISNNYNSNNVSVFRNNGSGTISFATKQDFATGLAPVSVTLGDFDGDGKLDIATANYNANTVSVLLNKSTEGNISFATKQDFATGINPNSVAIGDLDKDGKPDIASVNYNENSVSILRNTSNSAGSISFERRQNYQTGDYPYSVAIGDIDGDGKPEIAVANNSINNGTSSLSVILNNSTPGSIIFSAKKDYITGTNPVSVVIGDIDNDGKSDLALANFNSASISLFRNASTQGNINLVAKQDFATGAKPSCVVMSDLDGDGKVDLATSNYSGNSVSILRNKGNIGTVNFASNEDLNVGYNPNSLAIGDLDNDGKPEIISAVSNSNVVSIFRNNPVLPPLVSSFLLSYGSPGTTVNIRGSGFNPTPSNNIIYFGATKASISSAADNEVSVIVPSGATLSPITVLNSYTGLMGSSLNNYIPTFYIKKTTFRQQILLQKLTSPQQ